MKHIEMIKEFSLDATGSRDKDKEVNQLYDGAFRKLVEVWLQNNAVLSRHHADVPITVYCISGRGIFSAGANLEESQNLRAGTLITLAAGVDHEVSADPALHLIVTKFKGN